MKLGFVGIGKMGSRMVEKLLRDNHQVVVWNRSEEAISNFIRQLARSNLGDTGDRLSVAKNIKNLVELLSPPRIVWLMLPAGEVTDSILNEVGKFVTKGDIVIDGGNAHFADTERRSKEFSAKGVRFLGIGVSGGVVAINDGYPLMVGGDRSAYDAVTPLLNSLAKPGGPARNATHPARIDTRSVSGENVAGGGHAYFGTGGAGHYVKMVHNAIEYGYMQAIGEGFGVLEKATYDFDLEKVAKIYQKGTLISGFMMDRTADALEKDPKLEKIAGVIGRASGETVWTIEEAKKHDLPIEITEKSLEFRKQSETDEKTQKSFAARLISALRFEFGGHEVKKSKSD